MFKATIIGNLGASAELHKENGSEFVTFKVAHNERFKSSDGNTRETSVWISCLLNGRADNLRPYLVKGATVAVFGDLRLKTYHSAKMHALVAGADLFVRSIDLVGSKPDAIPSRLYDLNGVEHRVNKFYNCETAKSQELLTQAGERYMVDENGWLFPITTPGDQTQADATNTETATQPANVFNEDTTPTDGQDSPVY